MDGRKIWPGSEYFVYNSLIDRNRCYPYVCSPDVLLLESTKFK